MSLPDLPNYLFLWMFNNYEYLWKIACGVFLLILALISVGQLLDYFCYFYLSEGRGEGVDLKPSIEVVL